MSTYTRITLLSLLVMLAALSCRKTEPDRTGIIEGIITNVQTLEPIKGATVTVSSSSKTTGDDGKFRFEGLEPKEYIIEINADGFETNTKTIVVVASETKDADMSMTPLVPILDVSATVLNFGMSETILPITITNKGKSVLEWSVTENITWLSANPVSGSTSSQPSSLNITVDRIGLTPRIYTQSFIINSNGGNAIVTVNMTVQGPVPTAILNVTPQSGTTSQVFQLDASASTDDIDPTSSLMARWKWDDALSFSTWSTLKTDSYQYASEGIKNITLEVRDGQGNVGTDVRSVSLNNAYTLPTLATNAVTNITTTNAVCGGNVYTDGGTAVNQRGVCWSTDQNPDINSNHTTDGSGIGSFTSNLSGLSAGTTYYVKAYAKNDIGVNYGNQVFFKAGDNASPPSVTTSGVLINDATSITCGGNVISAGTSPVSARGVCWSTSSQPTISDDKTLDGSGLGIYQSNVANLVPGDQYYIRAYAINIVGTSYGDEYSFSTANALPVIQTRSVTNVSETSAITGGIVITEGGSSISEKGVCYSSSQNPTINDTHINCGTGSSSYSTPLSTLIPNSTYYVRAYATNQKGTVYGENKSFTTLNAYYISFESGIPSGWIGMWNPDPGNSFEGFYSLSSNHNNDTVSFTKTIAMPGSQISFEYMAGTYWGGLSTTRTIFYVDNVAQTTCSDGGWARYSFPLTVGIHTFKWENIGWYYNGQGYGNGYAYIDYIIIWPE